jgi:nucleoside-diphosphate-sugar epimerase
VPLPPLPKEDLEAVFCQVGKDWERLRGKNVFLTGGSGFFGSWLLETLLFSEDRLGLGVKVWALSRDPKRFRERLPYLAGHSSVHSAGGGVEGFVFPREKMNFVIHSMVPDPGMPLPEMEAWFGAGTARLLELAVRDKSQGFLLCSTGAVYQGQNRPLSEDDPLIPLAAPLSYGRIRRQVEDQCQELCKSCSIPLKIARGFAVAGPRLPLDANFALGNFIRDVIQGEPIKVKNGAPFRSYLYSADLTIWLWKILLQGRAFIPYNVGSDTKITISMLAQRIATVTRLANNSGVPDTREPLSGSDRTSDVYVPQTQRIISEMNLAKTTPLDESINKTLDYALSARDKN